MAKLFRPEKSLRKLKAELKRRESELGRAISNKRPSLIRYAQERHDIAWKELTRTDRADRAKPRSKSQHPRL